MLGQRILTALILLALIFGALAWSPLAFESLIAVAISIALWEWLRLARWRSLPAAVLAAALGAALLAAHLAGLAPSAKALGLVCGVATLAWLAITVVILRSRTSGFVVAPALASLLALSLLPVAWWAALHFYASGGVFLLSVVAIVWVADVAAYFSGRAFGRAKLAPAISPGKTWAGVWGAVAAVLGLALALAVAAPNLDLFTTRLLAGAGWATGLCLLAALTLISVVGDLLESQLKRNAGMKDSSHLLPGHGGVYDRIDALVPVLPAAVLLESLFR